MAVYYNEWDKPTAEWLRALCAGRHLPAGHVDTRSIRDVRAGDLRGYDQAHFFAGIGGWPLALRLAGYEHLPCWTGSPPCQPFSVAGQQRGNDDERHLAPVWLDLVRECKPPVLFGEQVEAAIRHGWLDDLFDALEAEGYTCGAAVLPACSVGAPHIRKRLFFGAVRLADAMLAGRSEGRSWARHRSLTRGGSVERVANANERERGRLPDGEGCQRNRTQAGRIESHGKPQPCCQPDGLDDAAGARCFGPLAGPEGQAWNEARMRMPGAGCADDGMANTTSLGRIRGRSGEACDKPGQVERPDGFCDTGRLADASGERWRQAGCHAPCDREAHARWSGDRLRDGGPHDIPSRMVGSSGASAHHGDWSGADWLGCRDGKFRPVEPGTQPLASGIPARVGRLRGYGNAIVPQVAAVFIQEFLGAFAEIQENTGG